MADPLEPAASPGLSLLDPGMILGCCWSWDSSWLIIWAPLGAPLPLPGVRTHLSTPRMKTKHRKRGICLEKKILPVRDVSASEVRKCPRPALRAAPTPREEMEPVITSRGNHPLPALGLSARQAGIIPQVLLLPLTAQSWAFHLPFPVLSSAAVYSSRQKSMAVIPPPHPDALNPLLHPQHENLPGHQNHAQSDPKTSIPKPKSCCSSPAWVAPSL